MDIKETAIRIAKRAMSASPTIRTANTKLKNNVLQLIAEKIEQKKSEVLKENEKDIEIAVKNKLSKALIDRLSLNDKKIQLMIESVHQVIMLTDPVGEIFDMRTRPNGLKIGRMRVPIGVIFIIYESRPNVTIESAILCIKSGNTAILRGGKESMNTNRILSEIIRESLNEAGLPKDGLIFVDSTDRELVQELLLLENYINLVIPRGGESLIRAVAEKSRIPVIKHYKGICHIYVDKDADESKALELCLNAKCQRPATCNAMETLLVHKDLSKSFLPKMVDKFISSGVELRGCPKTRKLFPNISRATEEDWHTEYLDLILSVKIVENLEEAIDHIEKYGSHHSDGIITENYTTAWVFVNSVDSAACYVNASTRFTDGFEFGLGAEVGISTDKIHCRGPMGLLELTVPKWIIFGNGQVRE
ncbi:MAG: glutamate-5-semialdehyde dehydrogenase [Candidatus Hydrogenedentota bacterium]